MRISDRIGIGGSDAAALNIGGSNCLPCQALTAAGGFHAVRRASIALRIVRSFRIHAVRATFFGFPAATSRSRSEEHTSELQSRLHLVCRLLLEKKKK